MANYNSYSRTNYFHVTNEARFREIVALITCEDNVVIWEGPDNTFGFGAYGSVDMYYDEEADEYIDIAPLLQEIIPDNEAIIIHEIGYEKLRYLVSVATIITNKSIEYVNMEDQIANTVSKMGIPFKSTDMTY